jgi:hypothetical protein
LVGLAWLGKGWGMSILLPKEALWGISTNIGWGRW